MPVQMLQALSSYLSRLLEKQYIQRMDGPPTCGVLQPEQYMDELQDFSCLISSLIHPYSMQRALFTWLGAKRCSGNCPAHPNEELH